MDETSVGVLSILKSMATLSERSSVENATAHAIYLDPLSCDGSDESGAREDTESFSIQRTQTHSLDHDLSMQQYALEWIGRAPCVDSVVVGMTQSKHVDEALRTIL